MFFNTAAQKALLEEIRSISKDHGKCAVNEQKLKYIEDALQELKTVTQRLSEGATSQGGRIGELESFQALIISQDLDNRVTDTHYAVKAFAESMERMEASMGKFTESIVTSVETLRKENSELKEASASKVQEHHKAVLFANMGEKVLIGLMLAAIIGVCTVVWNGLPK